MEVVDDERKELVKDLIAKRENIRETLFNAREQLNAIRELKTFDLETIMEVAQNLSYSGHAPPGWVPGAPLLKNHPPAPQPEEMRGGMLEKFNLLCKARSTQNISTSNVSVIYANAEARNLYNSILNAKETPAYSQILTGKSADSVVPMEIEESVADGIVAPVEDVQIGKGRKANTISFTSYDDDSSDDD